MMYFQSFDEVLSALKRRKGLIFLITFFGCVASVIIALLQTPVYKAIAVVQIEDAQVVSTNTSAGSTTDVRSSLDARRTVRLIEQRVMSRGTLFEIMDQHDLFNDDPSLTPTERLALMREAVTINAILSGEAWQPNQSVSGMVIEANLNDPQKAADVANDLLARVMEEARARSVDRAQVELEFFNIEERQIRKEIISAEAVIADFKTANSELLPSNITILQGELTTLNAALLTLRQQILSFESNSSRTRLEARQRQVAVLEDQIGLIEDRISEINGLLTQAPEIERELVSLERELAQLNEQFTVISRRKADAEMSQSLEEQRQLARFEVLEEAIVPVYAISRSKRSIAMMGGVASGMLAVGIAFLLELMNPPLRNANQLERTLGLRPVISVPVIETGTGVPSKGKGNGPKFGLGVATALLIAAIAAVAKPLAELAGITSNTRSAQ